MYAAGYRKVLILLSVFLFSPLLCSAQSNYAVFGGVACDGQHRALPGALVQLTSIATHQVRQAASDDRGRFEITGLLPGDYELSAKASGFVLLSQTVRLEVGQRATLELILQLASVQQTVEVKTQLDMLRTTDPSVGEVIEPIAIRELPLNGRSLIDLTLTVPGSHVGSGAQTGMTNPLYWRPGQMSAVSIGGNRPNANYFLLDGTTNTDPTFNTLNLSPSPDAVQEFKVQTGSYSAEMGGAGGGQVNIVTRSGANQFHGTAYEFLRNNALDARSFNEMDMGGNHLVQNNYGGSFSGPIRKEKTFFFINYEAMRHTMAMTMIETVPTLAERMGDFSQSGADIYNPYAANPNPAYDPAQPISPSNPKFIRDPFAGNVIPAGLIDSAAQYFLLNYVPLPNMGMGVGKDSNNYMDVRNEVHIVDQGTIRVDHLFEGGDSLTGRYSISAENGFMPQNLPGFGALHDNLSQQGTVQWTRIITPHMVNIASATVSRLAMHRASENNEANDIVSQLGIVGVGFGGQGAFGAPWFAVQGYSGMGDSFAATPMKAWDTVLEARDVLSWQRGRHSLKFGGSYRRFIWPMWGFFQNRGYYQFTPGFTTRTETNDGTGSALASFLLGLPAVKQRQAGIPQMQLRQWYIDGFAQDSWQISHSTTIDFGLRYEYMSPLVDLNYANTNLTFDKGVPQVFVGGELGYPAGLVNTPRLDFAPRFGIAQNFERIGLVVHAAYGIFYTPIDMNTWCNQRHNVPYVFPETQQSDNFVPSIFGFDFNPPVLGKTVVSFTANDPNAPAQYVQQWSTSLEKSLGQNTTLEVGYLGSRGIHLQRAHLINNALPGPGPIGPRRPFKTLSFVPGTELPGNVTVLSTTFPVSGINLLENNARSWYDAAYINLRRQYSRRLSLLANYTFSKTLADAPDFRSPMDESAIPQDNNDLAAEKGPGCDLRHRFVLSAVYELPTAPGPDWIRNVTAHWRLSSVYQIQSGFPFTISVFGDTANAGTLLGENPVRANYNGQPVFGSGTGTAARWFNTSAFSAPPAFTFGNAGRNSVYGPGLQTLDLAVSRDFSIRERMQFQVRGEFFNALNHTNLGTPNRFVNTPQFGTITQAATPGREIQLSARLSF